MLASHKTYEITYDGSFRTEDNQTLLWGPYQELKPGHYTFECLIEPLTEDFDIAFDIVKNFSERRPWRPEC